MDHSFVTFLIWIDSLMLVHHIPAPWMPPECLFLPCMSHTVTIGRLCTADLPSSCLPIYTPVHFQLIPCLCNSLIIKSFRTGKFNSLDNNVSDTVSGLQWLVWASPLLAPENVSRAWAYCTAGALCKQLHAMKSLNCNNRILHANIGPKWKPFFGSLTRMWPKHVHF